MDCTIIQAYTRNGVDKMIIAVIITIVEILLIFAAWDLADEKLG